MQRPCRPGARVLSPLVLGGLAIVLAGCGTAVAEPSARTAVAGHAVGVDGLDPVAVLGQLTDTLRGGWVVAGAGAPVRVTIDDVRTADPTRAQRYTEADFEGGARLSLARGEHDRIAVVADAFPHAAAARQLADWHVVANGLTFANEVSRVGSTAEGVVVLDDLLLRVVAVGEEAPDEDAVRTLLDAARKLPMPGDP
jgi:hypothetical protein